MANASAVELLKGSAAPGPVVITEGVPDFLSWATRIRAAVLGVVSGSWCDAIATRIPDGCALEIRTHMDVAGERYAELVQRSVGSRVRAARLAPEPSG